MAKKYNDCCKKMAHLYSYIPYSKNKHTLQLIEQADMLLH